MNISKKLQDALVKRIAKWKPRGRSFDIGNKKQDENLLENTKWVRKCTDMEDNVWFLTICGVKYCFSYNYCYNELQYCETIDEERTQYLMVGSEFKSLREVKKAIKKHFQTNYYKVHTRIYR